jgi:hypothetical protein
MPKDLDVTRLDHAQRAGGISFHEEELAGAPALPDGAGAERVGQ